MKPTVDELFERGQSARRKGDVAGAQSNFEAALKIDPEQENVLEALGELQLEAGNIEAASRYYLELVTQNSGKSTLLHDLGVLFRDLGHEQHSRLMFEQALSFDPNLTQTYYELSHFSTAPETGEQFEKMRRLCCDVRLTNLQRSYLGLALTKAYMDRSETKLAGQYLVEANRLRRSENLFSIRDLMVGFEQIKQFFSAKMVRSAIPVDAKITPIFVIGMPRSGTTLTEQILACHPQVGALGESNFFGDRMLSISQKLGKDFPAWMDTVTEESLSALGEEYLAYAAENAPGCSHVVEKTPFNFHFLGIIRAAIPHALFVHCRRDPRDTCFSIYQKSFRVGEHRYAYNQLELAQFYHLYEGLMNHWHEVCSDILFEQNYELLVTDFNASVKKLLASLALPFHEDCLRFYENRRPVHTASVEQVRQPIYTSSIGSWKPYQGSLQVMLQALAAEPVNALKLDISETAIQPALAEPDLNNRVNLLKKVLQEKMLYLPAHRELVLALKQLGRYEEALVYAEAAAELQPEVAARHYQLGTVLFALDRHSSAVAALRCAVTLKPSAAHSHGLLAYILQQKGETALAVEHARKALASIKDEPYALSALESAAI